jgi:hypothetical protein
MSSSTCGKQQAPSSTPATRPPRDWVKDQAAKILDGKACDVRAGIRRRATCYGYSPKEREGADACATYLENKKDYLDYPAFLAAGWPVASGLIEGAARWLIKDRMQVTGARWNLDGAEAVLKLRALALLRDLLVVPGLLVCELLFAALVLGPGSPVQAVL